ncbi:MAG: radical SAM protein [Chloroflexota bacterium]|nr:MAG: radical SAM protein [Chloroflexota bacterium]
MNKPRKGRFLTWRRMQNYALNLWEKQRGQTVLRSRPLLIYSESTTRCNARCIMCPRSNGPLPIHDMNMETFRRVAGDVFPTALVTFMQGTGEPLISKNFDEMLSVAKSYGMKVSCHTNGTVMTPDRARKLVASGINVINFSVDAVQEDIFQSIRPGASLRKVLRSIEMLDHARKELHRSNPAIGFAFVAMRRNAEELPKVVELAHQVGARWVMAKGIIPLSQNTFEESLLHEPDRARAVAREAKAMADKYHVSLSLGSELTDPEAYSISRQGAGDGRGLCQEPWETVFITADGSVEPCCILYSGEPMGNIHEQSFDEIWNNEKYQRLRAMLYAGKMPEACKDCPTLWVRRHTARYSRVLLSRIRRGPLAFVNDLKPLWS